MRIDENSYYIKYVIVRGKEYAYLSHYKNVWSNGFTVDDYSFDNEGFCFEDAGHNGVNPDDKTAGTRIFKRYYDRWVKRIDNCKQEIERMANKHSFPYGKMWKGGDYLYFPLKEIYAEEYAKEAEDFPDEFIEEENKYNGPELCLVHVTNEDQQNPEGYEVRINNYRTEFDNDDEEPGSLDYYLDYIDKSRLIPKEVFERAKELIHKEATEIMNEIKQKVSKIEKA